MERHLSVNLLNLLLSLSDAMDLAGPELVQHQQRTAFIVWEMARAGGLPEEAMEQMFFAALLHDIGAFSVEEKYALLRSETERTDEHCIRGEVLLKKLPWLSTAATLVRHHHTKWTECRDEMDDSLVLQSQVLGLADCLERAVDRNVYILHQHRKLISEITERSGTGFHPDAVDLFVSTAAREEFWLDLTSRRLYSLLLHGGPNRKLKVDFTNLFLIAEIFANIIDFRSRFTSTHSSGVSASATMLSRIFGLTEPEIAAMEVAGYLHDVGKLAVPNRILEKPGKLTREEFAVIKCHTYYTYSILDSVGGLQQIAEWGAYHHERLDGTGYPFHCASQDLTIGSRIMMVADMFTAMAEDRPYRRGMSRKEIARILEDCAARGLLERRIVALLMENYGEVASHMRERQEAAREFYENQFVFLKKALSGT